MSSDKNKQPNQTTVTPTDAPITPRELTPEEAERVSGGVDQGPLMAMSGTTPTG